MDMQTDGLVWKVNWMRKDLLKITSHSEKLICNIGGILLFTMILIPTYYMNFKILMLLLLLSLILAMNLGAGKKVVICKSVLKWFCVYIGAGIFYIILSVIHKNENPLTTLNVNVIEPFLIMLIICSIKRRHFKYIFNVMLFSIIVVEVYNIIFTLCINNIVFPVSISPFFISAYKNLGGLSLGIIKFGSSNLSWLIFLVPMFFGLSLIKGDFDRQHTFLYIVITILGVINALLCLRTAFLLCIALTPILVLIFGKICHIKIDKNRLIVVGILGLIVCCFLLVFWFEEVSYIVNGVITRVLGSFSTKSFTNQYNMIDNAGAIRMNQIEDLLKTWMKKPLLGWGDSANSMNIIRSNVSGAYEMTYFALLMQRGIVGFAIYWGQVIWMFRKLIAIVKKKEEFVYETFGIMIGLSAFLIANATNPYLQSFDRLIILFLPLALINMDVKKEYKD